MATNLDSISFCKKLSACIKEYKKQVSETGDDIDAAYFYDKGLKKWIKDNMECLNILSSHGLDKGFMVFVKHYLFDKD
jgi:hypothetical protein